MKIKNCVLATLLLAIPSITFAAGAEFDGKLYSEVKAKATKAAQSENVPAASKPAEVKNENSANQKVNAFTVSDLSGIMTAEDYEIFLDSLVIKEGKLVCADNDVLWKYSDNEIIRGIGKIVSKRNTADACSTEIIKSNKNNINRREFLKSIMFLNGNAASWSRLTDNEEDICDEDSQYNFVCNQGGNTLKKNHICKRRLWDGNKFGCVQKKNEECDEAYCNNTDGYLTDIER